MATTYELVRNGKVSDTRSSKDAAIKLATRPGDLVRTSAGTVVHEVPGKAKRTMRADRFAPFTRVDSRPAELGEGIKLPANYEVAYVRPRQGFAMLRHTGESKKYLLVNLKTGDKHEVATCRESAELVKALAAKEAKKAGKAKLTAVA